MIPNVFEHLNLGMPGMSGMPSLSNILPMMGGGGGGPSKMLGGGGGGNREGGKHIVKIVVIVFIVFFFISCYGSSSGCASTPNLLPGSNSNSYDCYGLANGSGYSNDTYDHGLTVDETTGANRFGSGSFKDAKWS